MVVLEAYEGAMLVDEMGVATDHRKRSFSEDQPAQTFPGIYAETQPFPGLSEMDNRDKGSERQGYADRPKSRARI